MRPIEGPLLWRWLAWMSLIMQDDIIQPYPTQPKIEAQTCASLAAQRSFVRFRKRRINSMTVSSQAAFHHLVTHPRKVLSTATVETTNTSASHSFTKYHQIVSKVDEWIFWKVPHYGTYMYVLYDFIGPPHQAICKGPVSEDPSSRWQA